MQHIPQLYVLLACEHYTLFSPDRLYHLRKSFLVGGNASKKLKRAWNYAQDCQVR